MTHFNKWNEAIIADFTKWYRENQVYLTDHENDLLMFGYIERFITVRFDEAKENERNLFKSWFPNLRLGTDSQIKTN